MIDFQEFDNEEIKEENYFDNKNDAER